MSAATKSGFVLSITTPTAFDVGGTDVVLNDDAECETETLDEAIVLKRKIYDGVRAHMYLLDHDTLLPASVTSIPCKTLGLHVGTRISLVGEQDKTGVFAATHATAYRVHNSKILPLSQDPRILKGGALFEEAPDVHSGLPGWTESMWLDGYPMSIGPQAAFSEAPASSTLAYGFFGFSSRPRFEVKPDSACSSHLSAAALSLTNMWVLYEGDRAANGDISAVQLCLWPNEPNDNGAARKSRTGQRDSLEVIPPNYQLQRPGWIKMPHGKRLEIVPDERLQDWISKLGEEIVPEYQRTLLASDPAKIHFRFYVVHGSGAALGYAINVSKGWIYGISRPNFDDAAVALPNGAVIVTDSTVAKVTNAAQLAAILSYAVTSAVQEQASVRRDSSQYLGGGESGPTFTTYALAVLHDEQQIRIGIRQMYLAGYDIREAPFAWAVAQRKPVNNPVIDFKQPDADMPWYAAYAFNYISEYYKDVDYSKLKRGEAEYQPFLGELRKADPEAFGDVTAK